MTELIIIPSLVDLDVYFIFRNNSQEVKVITKGNYAQASHKLTVDELNFINENIL